MAVPLHVLRKDIAAGVLQKLQRRLAVHLEVEGLEVHHVVLCGGRGRGGGDRSGRRGALLLLRLALVLGQLLRSHVLLGLAAALLGLNGGRSGLRRAVLGGALLGALVLALRHHLGDGGRVGEPGLVGLGDLRGRGRIDHLTLRGVPLALKALLLESGSHLRHGARVRLLALINVPLQSGADVRGEVDPVRGLLLRGVRVLLLLGLLGLLRCRRGQRDLALCHAAQGVTDALLDEALELGLGDLNDDARGGHFRVF